MLQSDLIILCNKFEDLIEIHIGSTLVKELDAF